MMLAGQHRNRLMTTMLLVVLTFALTGCWDYHDVEQRAFVLALGLDITEDNEFLVSALIQRPTTRISQQTNPGGQAAGTPTRVVVRKAPSLNAGFEAINGITYRELHLNQLSVVVIGEDLARKGLVALDWIVRVPGIPSTAFLAVAHGTALEIVSHETPAAVDVATYLAGAFSETSTFSVELTHLTIWEALIRRFFSPFEDVYLPAVDTEPYGVNYAGAALFRDNRLVGWLDREMTAHLNLLVDHDVRGQVTTNDPEFGLVSVRLDRGSVSYTVRETPAGLLAEVDVTAFVSSIETPEAGIESVAELQRLDAVLSSVLQEQLLKFLRKTQELRVDPLGFGERLRQQNPDHPALESSASWRAALAEADLNVEARLRTRSRGREQ